MIKISKVTPCFGESSFNQRIEVKLSNDLEFTVFIDEDTGKVSILCNEPVKLGADLISNKGWMIKSEHYGHPYED